VTFWVIQSHPVVKVGRNAAELSSLAPRIGSDRSEAPAVIILAGTQFRCHRNAALWYVMPSKSTTARICNAIQNVEKWGSL